MRVPFFNYGRAFTDREDEYVDAFKDVLRRGAFIMQKDLADFEAAVAEFAGVKHCIGLANATDALEIMVKFAGIGPGDEVIICSHTMAATASSIATAGATVVPVELAEDGLLCVDSARAAITDKTKAIMLTQLNGRTMAMEPLLELVEEKGLMLLEDSAQGLGSRYKGRMAGTFGLGGCLSFYPAKILGCPADGGALLTNSDELAEYTRLVRDHGRGHDGDVYVWGRNSRLDNLQAAILHLQFKDYDTILNRRRAIAQMYIDRLGGIDAIELPAAPGDGDHFDTFQNFEIQADRRDELKVFLGENNIGTLIQWGGRAVHSLKRLGFTQDLPKTDRFFERCIMLPMNMTLTDEEISYVGDKVAEFYA